MPYPLKLLDVIRMHVETSTQAVPIRRSTTRPHPIIAGLSTLMVVVFALVIFAHAAQSSRPQSATDRSLSGIYLVANIDRGDSLAVSGSRRDFSAALSNRYINGAFLKTSWSDLEPADGAYEWSALDAQVKIAEGAGKKVALGVQAGTKTPGWVYAEGAKPFHTITTEAADGNFCQSQSVPIPWDPVFLRKWTAFVAAFGARYANDPHISEVKITGINTTTNETKMPHSPGETRSKKKGSRAGIPCTFPNDDANWLAAGYTQAKVFGAWKRMATAFAVAFPKQALTVMTSTHSMPSVGPDGRYDATGSAEAFATNTFLSYGAAAFGKRFAAAQNGWRPNHLDAGVLSFAAKTGNPFGWQHSWPIKCEEEGRRVHLGSGDCTERRAVEELFRTGLQSHPTYLELLHPVSGSNAYDDLIKEAYMQVMGR